MATISKRLGYAQGINLTGAYAWLMIYHYTLRKTTPIGNPLSSDVFRRLDKYLCVRAVKSLATMFTDCYSI